MPDQPGISSTRHSPGRILVRGVNWLGDAVMSAAALQRLHEARPAAEITWFGPSHLTELWLGHPAVHQTIGFAPGDTLSARVRRLREGRFDCALVLPNSFRSALEVFLAGIPQRFGYRRRGRSWLLTHPVPPRAEEVRMRKRPAREVKRLIASSTLSPGPSWPAQAHHLHHYLRLVAALGASSDPLPPRLVVSAEEREAACRKFGLSKLSGTSRRLLGLNPGAAYGPAKQWLADRFAEAAAEVQSQVPCEIVILGTATERQASEALAASIRTRVPAGSPAGGEVHVLAGRTTLRELLAVLALCDVLLTNDSGPMHAAAALGTPVVAIFGSTSPALTAPGLPGDPSHALLRGSPSCAPCFRRVCPIDLRCMHDVAVKAVVEAVVERLRPDASSPSDRHPN